MADTSDCAVNAVPPNAVVGLAMIEGRRPGTLGAIRTALTEWGGLADISVAAQNDRDLEAALAWVKVAGDDASSEYGGGVSGHIRVVSDAERMAVALPYLRRLLELESSPDLVVSWPVTLPRLNSVRYTPSRVALVQLLDCAALSVVATFPFVDHNGLFELEPALQRSLDRGVSLTLVTRHVLDESSANARLVDRLRARSKQNASINVLNIRGPSRDRSREKQYELLHAKVLVVDDLHAYVGSVNLTGVSLSDSFEVGFRVSGPAAAQVGALLRCVTEVVETQG
jgi:hypothetical protein